MGLLIRTAILGTQNMTLQDFKNREEAFATADAMYEENKAMIGYGYEPTEHEDPLLTKFYFVDCKGKKRTWSHKDEKSLALEADVSKKPKEALADMPEMALDLSVQDAGAAGSGVVDIKIENPKKVEALKLAEELKSAHWALFYKDKD